MRVISKTLPSLLSLAATASLAVSPVMLAAQQQQAPAQAPSQADVDAANVASLGLPANISVLGKNDPNKRTATALVNGQVITGTDIDQRLALLIAANKGVTPSAEEMTRLRAQVLRNLIDETLQIQEAAVQKMPVEREQVDASYARVAAQNFGRDTAKMDEYLKSIGSSAVSLKRQIEGEIAWNNLLRRNVQPFINVSNDEVNDVLARMEASRGTEEYRLGEIFLAATPETAQQVDANARKIVEQIKQGGNFVAYARQFSEASTAAVGGDLGYVRLETLPNEMAEVARQLQVGQLVGPFAIPGGYEILLLIDKRAVLSADPRDAVLSLKQISITFPPGTKQADANGRVKAFSEGVRTLKGCGDADEGAARLGAQVVENDQIKMRALPDQLQSMMVNLQVGQTTPPFGSVEEGVRVLMLCGRDDPQADGKPSFEQIMAQMEDERVGKRAQRYLRDLRNDAYIEYN